MVIEKCFVDTNCWIGLLNQDDDIHKLADREYKHLMKSGTYFITTTAVLNETANALSEPKFRASVVEFYHRLQLSSRIKIVFVDYQLWSDGWQLYEKRFDKAWSLTDCISMIVMQKEKIRVAITNDKHFEQAGFQSLLRK